MPPLGCHLQLHDQGCCPGHEQQHPGWSKNYDLHFDGREAQAAVDAMQTWWQHLLAKQQPVLVEAPAEEGGAEMSASEGKVSRHFALTTALCASPLHTLPWSMLLLPLLTTAWWSGTMMLCTSLVPESSCCPSLPAV